MADIVHTSLQPSYIDQPPNPTINDPLSGNADRAGSGDSGGGNGDSLCDDDDKGEDDDDNDVEAAAAAEEKDKHANIRLLALVDNTEERLVCIVRSSVYGVLPRRGGVDTGYVVTFDFLSVGYDCECMDFKMRAKYTNLLCKHLVSPPSCQLRSARVI